jgi:hypothetical protein
MKKKTKTAEITINKTAGIYKSIYSDSIKFTVFFIGLYYLIKLFLPDFFNQETIVIKVFVLVVEFVLFAVVNVIAYQIVYRFKKKKWPREHRKIWVEGLWLSIHTKANGTLRIGKVDITQDFYSIRAKGVNISASATDNAYETMWEYYMGKVADDETARDFIGCYSANRTGDGGNNSNDGIHILQGENSDDAGYVNELRGRFNDVVKVTDKTLNPTDRKGDLYLFRASKDCEKYLAGSVKKLHPLLKDDRFKDEPFVREVNNLLRKTYVPSFR